MRHTPAEVRVMTEKASKLQAVLGQLAIVLVIVFIFAGLVWYGVSADVRQRVWRDLIERPGGIMTFRFFLQPAMAALAALRDGIKDARAGRSAYFWTVLTSRTDRVGRLHEGLISTAQIILLGLIMDTIYQVLEFKTFYPVESVIVALVLAFVPYVLLRGPIARIARWWLGGSMAAKRRQGVLPARWNGFSGESEAGEKED